MIGSEVYITKTTIFGSVTSYTKGVLVGFSVTGGLNHTVAVLYDKEKDRLYTEDLCQIKTKEPKVGVKICWSMF